VVQVESDVVVEAGGTSRHLERLPLRLLPAGRSRVGAVLAAVLFSAVVLPASASAAKVPLVLEKAGTGTGTVTISPSGVSCGTTCPERTVSFTEGTEVTLTATPKADSHFEGWYGCDEEPTVNTCKITIVEESFIEAEFNEIEKYPLTVEKAGTGTGSVTSSPAGINCGTACPEAEAEYLEGTKVVLTASAGAGSYFEGWYGCDAEPSPGKCEVTILEWTTVEAEFNEIEKYPLTVEKIGTGTGSVTSSPAGINCGTACPEAEAEYPEGSKVVLTASAGAGSAFGGWYGCDANPSATKCEVTILEWTTVEAEFNLSANPKFPLKVKRIGSGVGKVSSAPAGIECGSACEAEFDGGKTVVLTQVAEPGSEFVKWSGACSGSGACEVTMSAAREVGAEFAPKAIPDSPPSCATVKSLCPPPPAGMARGGAVARVKGGKAALRLACTGGPCEGKLKLEARVRRGRKTQTVVVGEASFGLAEGASKTITVKLSGPIKKALDGGKSIGSKLTGTSIASSTVKLTPVKK
jgi:hypothetical protein